MLSEKWSKLQNGSDVRGVAIDGIDGEKVNLTPEVAKQIACSFATWLSLKECKPLHELSISIGRDSRLSGPELLRVAIEGLVDLGCKVFNCGLASTPAMFMSTVLPGFEYDGGIMLTASHLPFNRNGLKFFTKDGGLEKKDITALLEIAEASFEKLEAGTFEKTEPDIIKEPENKGKITNVDLISAYTADMVQKIRECANNPYNFEKPLSGLRIIVDAGNGAGGFFAAKVLEPLGADTTGSQFLEPDGSFPNHIPNPEDKDAMEAIKSAVLINKADFGIIFDTDVDRAGAVDRTGKEINRNRIIALMAAIVLDEHPHSTIVTDSITSSELKLFIEEKLGGVHHRFKRGYKNVINEAIRLNSIGQESHLAIETSGHGALKENYFLDDGAYLIAKILIKIAKLKLQNKTVDLLLSELKEPLESKEFRLNILEKDFKSFGTMVIEELTQYANQADGWHVEPKNYEGVRISFDESNGNGWLLLRLSLHDPLLPLNVESNMPGGVKLITTKLLDVLSKYTQLDISSIGGYLNLK